MKCSLQVIKLCNSEAGRLCVCVRDLAKDLGFLFENTIQSIVLQSVLTLLSLAVFPHCH